MPRFSRMPMPAEQPQSLCLPSKGSPSPKSELPTAGNPTSEAVTVWRPLAVGMRMRLDAIHASNGCAEPEPDGAPSFHNSHPCSVCLKDMNCTLRPLQQPAAPSPRLQRHCTSYAPPSEPLAYRAVNAAGVFRPPRSPASNPRSPIPAILRGKGALPFDDRPFSAVNLGEEVRPFPTRIHQNGGPSA